MARVVDIGRSHGWLAVGGVVGDMCGQVAVGRVTVGRCWWFVG